MGGIVDFDICYPSSWAKAQEMHAQSGLSVADILEITHCDAFPALGEDEKSWKLALQAARSVIARTKVSPAAIRQVIYAGSGEWDIPFWSPAAKVAQQLGIDRAHCFEIANFCSAGMTALQVASDKIALGHTDNVLILVGDRLSQMVDYRDPDSKELFNFGDAAAAILVARAGCTFRLLHSAMRTDPGWSDYYVGEHQTDRVVIRRKGHRQGLAAAYVENFSSLVDDTLATLARKMSDVAYLLINQGDKRMHERLVRTLGISPEKSVYNYHRLGHMGGADTWIALRDLLVEQKLKHGDLILLATSAMGFSWGITALEYQNENPHHPSGSVPKDGLPPRHRPQLS
ncbi:MAG: 3-oxoacyl-ACP synthase III family protein [Pseudonocardia sp.]